MDTAAEISHDLPGKSFSIETDQPVKHYGNVRAVDGLSLRVAPGEIYAFLGLNGAGKTTTIRMLVGLVRPTSGSAHVMGNLIEPGGKKPWSSVGYMIETPYAYPELSVRENLDAVRRLRPGTPPKAVDQIIELLGLSTYADRRAGTLSQGNAQRLALLHRLVREQGVTVFMSSHILEEVSRLAHRIGIIHQGGLIQELDVDELEHNRRRRLLIRARDNEEALAVLTGAGYSAELADGQLIEIKADAAICRPSA